MRASLDFRTHSQPVWKKVNALGCTHEPLHSPPPSPGLPRLCILEPLPVQLQRACGRAGGGGGSGAPRAQAGQVVGKGPGMQCIYSVTPRRFPDPFDLPGQTFLLLFPCVYWKGCVWCSVPFSSVHGTARGSRCSRNLFWRKTCSEHREKMGKLAVLINICKQNLFLMFDMRAV